MMTIIYNKKLTCKLGAGVFLCTKYFTFEEIAGILGHLVELNILYDINRTNSGLSTFSVTPVRN